MDLNCQVTTGAKAYGTHTKIWWSPKAIWLYWRRNKCIVLTGYLTPDNVKYTPVQALKLCIGRTAHRGVEV
jgi:hypothetical protein